MGEGPVNPEFAKILAEGEASGEAGSGGVAGTMKAAYGVTGEKSDYTEAELELMEKNKPKKSSTPLLDRLRVAQPASGD